MPERSGLPPAPAVPAAARGEVRELFHWQEKEEHPAGEGQGADGGSSKAAAGGDGEVRAATWPAAAAAYLSRPNG